jgi:hypothetical protein
VSGEQTPIDAAPGLPLKKMSVELDMFRYLEWKKEIFSGAEEAERSMSGSWRRESRGRLRYTSTSK